MSEPSKSTWLVRLQPRFVLLNPQALAVDLPTRKAEALMALLALAGKAGLRSDVLMERLWGNKEASKRAANLRQTVRRLRQVVGSESVLVRNGLCSVANIIQVHPDDRTCSDGQVTGSSPDWMLDIIESPTPRPAPVAALVDLVLWMLDQSPHRAIDLLRSHHEIAMQISPVVLRPIVETCLKSIPMSSPDYAWSCYFNAMANFQSGGYESVSRAFRHALELARQNADVQLDEFATLFLGATGTTYGNLALAKSASARLKAVHQGYAGTQKRGVHVALDGGIFIADGNMTEGFAKLSQASRLLESHPGDRMQIDMERAMTFALLGKVPESETALQQPLAFRGASEMTRLDFLIRIVELHLLHHREEFSTVIESGQSLIRALEASDSLQLSLLAREAVVASAVRAGEINLASAQLRSLVASRHRLKMTSTPWERARLSGLDATVKAANAR